MEIVVENLQKRVTLNPPQILKIAKTILRHEGINKASLSIVFVTRQRIQALNKRFLRRSYSTDVLAFDTGDGDSVKGKKKRKTDMIAGDVIISTDAAIKNSCQYETELSSEIALYVIHGILHLLGYDDYQAKDIKKMRKKEQELLSYLGVKTKGILK